MSKRRWRWSGCDGAAGDRPGPAGSAMRRRRAATVRAATVRAAAAALLGAPLGAVASAAPAAASPITYTFGENTQGQGWTVPPGITSGTFDLVAAIGQGGACDRDGGYGGETKATIPLTPGETLQVNVGDSYYGEVNSGNASDVRRGAFGLADRLLGGGSSHAEASAAGVAFHTGVSGNYYGSVTITIHVPTVTGLSSHAGPTAGGQSVTVTGRGFTGATRVTFGARPATHLVVVSDTKLTVTTPARPAGTVNVHVTGPAGTSVTVPADRYTYR
jgi:hypothetical protein